MSASERLDDRISQEGWTIQPTHAEGEYRLSHDGIHVTFHEARFRKSDGIAHARLYRHSGSGTTTVAEISLPAAPWRIEEWLRQLVAETSGVSE